MIKLTTGSVDKPHSVRTRAASARLAAVLLANIAAITAASWLGLLGWGWGSQRARQAQALTADAGRFVASLCIANPESEAMRQWIAQHPKSPRGRLDHRRSNAATAG